MAIAGGRWQAVREGLKICLERVRIMIDVYKHTDGEPMTVRRAKALAAILDRITLFIRENELIVGFLQVRKPA